MRLSKRKGNSEWDHNPLGHLENDGVIPVPNLRLLREFLKPSATVSNLYTIRTNAYIVILRQHGTT
jgi:hypothetical protein